MVRAQFTLTYDPAVMTCGEISTGTAVSNRKVFDEQSSGKISVTLLSASKGFDRNLRFLHPGKRR